jgi:transcriptional antiterminator RfaH
LDFRKGDKGQAFFKEVRPSEGCGFMGRDGRGRVQAGERWFVVHTHPKREWRAEAQLVNQGFRVFIPKRLKTVRHARKFTTVLAPFFPRYLFVALDPAQHRWRSVNGTFGVCSLVMVGESPQPVPVGVVEAMIAATDSNGRQVIDSNLEVGSSVRLLAGPFADQLGRLSRLDDAGRVHVLLEIMGASIPVQMPRQFVTAA